MKNILLYIGLTLLALYILSPLDAHPFFLDDLIASAIFIYLLYKSGMIKKQQRYNSSDKKETYEGRIKAEEVITVDDAYRLLEVRPDASWEEIKRAYKEKIAKNHPDKVSHLSRELQDRAKELTLRLNRAFEIIKAHKNKH